MMPNFDPTITLGNVITMIGIVVGLWISATRLYGSVDRRLAVFEVMLSSHAKTLIEHNIRMEKQDDMLLRLMGEIQRLVGRLESTTQRRNEGSAGL